MRERHYGHRSEIRSGADGLGKHFLEHGANLNLKNDVQPGQPGQPWTQDNLDRLEGKLQKYLMYGLQRENEYQG